MIKEIRSILIDSKDSKSQSQKVLMNERIIIDAMAYAASLKNTFSFIYLLISSKENYYSVSVNASTVVSILIEFGTVKVWFSLTSFKKNSEEQKGYDSNKNAADKLNSLLHYEVLLHFDQNDEDLTQILKRNSIKAQFHSSK